MSDRLLICERCDAREGLGGNPEARIKLLIGIGWHYGERSPNFCPTCWRIIQTERKPRAAI